MWELFLSLDAMVGSSVKQTTRLPRLLSLSTKLEEHLKPSKKLSTAKQDDVQVSVIVLYFINVPHWIFPDLLANNSNRYLIFKQSRFHSFVQKVNDILCP